MEPDSPILSVAAGSLPASSPYRKGAERRFEETADLLADRLAVVLFDVSRARNGTHASQGVPWPFCQGSLIQLQGGRRHSEAAARTVRGSIPCTATPVV